MSKVLMKVGGQAGAGSLVIEDNGGNVEVKVDGNKVLDAQQSAITDASEAHALNASFSDTEAEAALNALGAKINAIIAALEAHGLIAS